MEYKGFDFLKKLYFVRTAGSKEENKAYKMIVKECEKLNVPVEVEDFKIDGYKIAKASLKFSSPKIEVECVGVGMSGSTPAEGISGEFVYVDSLFAAKMLDIENKICLVHAKFVDYKLYKIFTEKKVAGIIVCTGDVYDKDEDIDLDPYMLRERHYTNGKIPAVCIKMTEAEKIINKSPKTVQLVVEQEEKNTKSHNVIATIESSKYKDEVVVFTAHYDSVAYSKGAYDNGTGTCAILQLMSYFTHHQPKRTLKFVFCGAEEIGLEGSKAYVAKHEEELKNYKLCINVDMIGVTIGRDDAICSSDMSLVHYLKYLSSEVGFPLNVKQSIYSSDSSPFADKSVPAVSFVRSAPTGGARIHSRRDIMDHLSDTSFYRTCEFMANFSERLINSYHFPVEREIPNNIKEDLDKYFGRK